MLNKKNKDMSELNPKSLNLSLKNLKFHEDMSEETPCFSADLYEDGKLIAHVKNSGRGGCNSVDPASGLKYKDVQHLTDIDTDCYIMQLAEELNFQKTIKKDAKKGILIKTDSGYEIKKFKAGSIQNMLTKFNNEQVLMAIQKTVNIYLKQKETILNKEYLESIGVKL